jgi:hypothetical protein
LKDLHKVVEHPERLNNRLLEKRHCQEGILLSICRKREEETQNLSRGLSVCVISRWIAPVSAAKDFARSAGVGRILCGFKDRS